MFNEELVMYFIGQNMIPVKLNTEDLEVLYILSMDCVKAVMVYNHEINKDISVDKHKHVREQVIEKLSLKHNLPVKTVAIICTDTPNEVEELICNTTSSDERWIVDTKNNVVIVGEDNRIVNEDVYKNVEEVIKAESYRRAYVAKDKGMFAKEPSVARTRINRTIGRKKVASKGVWRDYILTVTTALILINVFIHFDLERMGSTYNPKFMLDYGAMHWRNIFEEGEVWRLFTSMFMHFGIDHLIGNMFVLFLLGNALEQAIGKIRFLIIYLGSGMAAGLASAFYYWSVEKNVVSAGASGAIYGVMGAMIAVFIVCKIRTSLNLRGLIIYSIISIVNSMNSEEVDHTAHMGGFTSGIVLAIILLLVLPNDKIQERGSGRY